MEEGEGELSSSSTVILHQLLGTFLPTSVLLEVDGYVLLQTCSRLVYEHSSLSITFCARASDEHRCLGGWSCRVGSKRDFWRRTVVLGGRRHC